MSSGCRQEKAERYSLDSIFNKVELILTDSINKINICEYIPSDWDSILIIKPYTAVSQQETLNELVNFSKIKSEIEDIEFADAICYLLFVKNEKIVGYGSIRRSPIDFAFFPPESQNVAIIKRSDCDKLFLKKGTAKLSIM